jgi:hypothetical protein
VWVWSGFYPSRRFIGKKASFDRKMEENTVQSKIIVEGEASESDEEDIGPQSKATSDQVKLSPKMVNLVWQPHPLPTLTAPNPTPVREAVFPTNYTKGSNLTAVWFNATGLYLTVNVKMSHQKLELCVIFNRKDTRNVL